MKIVLRPPRAGARLVALQGHDHPAVVLEALELINDIFLGPESPRPRPTVDLIGQNIKESKSDDV